MLHIATVHFKTPQWIEIQTRQLRRHVAVPYRMWASLAHIDRAYAKYFDRVIESRGQHSGKLNLLAIEISAEADDEDLLMFLDGDAFPIEDPMPLIADGLARAPLLAVRRAENMGEPQPHPCFCVTTVGRWRDLPGDWSLGATWPEVGGRIVSDVGANLLRVLELTDTPWVQVLRTNGTSRHPLFFGIYGGAIYHHGGGFRDDAVITREDRRAAAERGWAPEVGPLAPLARRVNLRRYRAWRAATVDDARRQSQRIFEKIERDDPDWVSELLDDAAPQPSHSPSA
jgi:hypothetical protein